MPVKRGENGKLAQKSGSIVLGTMLLTPIPVKAIHQNNVEGTFTETLIILRLFAINENTLSSQQTILFLFN